MAEAFESAFYDDLVEEEVPEEQFGFEEDLSPGQEAAPRPKRRKIPPAERKSKAEMNKFELARIIGARAKMIDLNAAILVPEEFLLMKKKGAGGKFVLTGERIRNPLDIALVELLEVPEKFPIFIERPYTNGEYEIWYPDELRIPPRFYHDPRIVR